MDLERLLSLCLATHPVIAPDGLWRDWSLAPVVVLPLALALGSYLCGLRASGAPAWRVACFAGGWLVLAGALVSPLCRLAGTLVSAHMVQHALLVAVAPPLLVLGAPLAVMRAAWPGAARRAGSAAYARRYALPLPATLCYGLAIWLWHFPPVYSAVLLDAVVHTLAYAVLVALSLLFWSVVLAPGKGGSRLHGVPMLFVTLVHTGVLGALLTFSSNAWYPVLAGGAAAWGLSPLADQQLGGLIMWVPMSATYLAAALALVGASLGLHEHSAQATG